MNSQDLHNLQEAYTQVYSVDEERAPGVKPYRPNRVQPLPEPKPLSGKKGDGDGYGADKKFTQDTDRASFRPGVDVPAVKQFGRISRIIPHGIGAHANKTQSRVSTITRKDPGAPTSQKLPPQEKKKPSREIVRKTQKEDFDLYDIILSHLLDEGYADTQEAAEAIMVNMSEEWRESICEEYKKLPDQKMSGQIVRKLKIHDPNYYKPGALTQAQKLINVMDTHSERKEKAKSKLNKNK